MNEKNNTQKMRVEEFSSLLQEYQRQVTELQEWQRRSVELEEELKEREKIHQFMIEMYISEACNVVKSWPCNYEEQMFLAGLEYEMKTRLEKLGYGEE